MPNSIKLQAINAIPSERSITTSLSDGGNLQNPIGRIGADPGWRNEEPNRLLICVFPETELRRRGQMS
jgi:hypothetical protein